MSGNNFTGRVINKNAIGKVEGFHLFNKNRCLHFLITAFKQAFPIVEIKAVRGEEHFLAIRNASNFYFHGKLLFQESGFLFYLFDKRAPYKPDANNE